MLATVIIHASISSELTGPTNVEAKCLFFISCLSLLFKIYMLCFIRKTTTTKKVHNAVNARNVRRVHLQKVGHLCYHTSWMLRSFIQKRTETFLIVVSSSSMYNTILSRLINTVFLNACIRWRLHTQHH